jgi:hypothetical protein
VSENVEPGPAPELPEEGPGGTKDVAAALEVAAAGEVGQPAKVSAQCQQETDPGRATVTDDRSVAAPVHADGPEEARELAGVRGELAVREGTPVSDQGGHQSGLTLRPVEAARLDDPRRAQGSHLVDESGEPRGTTRLPGVERALAVGAVAPAGVEQLEERAHDLAAGAQRHAYDLEQGEAHELAARRGDEYVAGRVERARLGGVDVPDPERVAQVRRELAVADRGYDASRAALVGNGGPPAPDEPRLARLGDVIEVGGGVFRVECRPAWGAFHNGEHLVELPAGDWIACTAAPVFTGDRVVGTVAIEAVVIQTPRGRSARLTVSGRGEGAQGAVLLLVHA